MRARIIHAVPDTVGHPNAMLERSLSRSRPHISARVPADALSPNLQLLSPPRRPATAILQTEANRVVSQTFTQHVDRDLKSKRSLRMTRRPKGAGRPGVHEHVVIGHLDVGAVIDAKKWPGSPSPKPSSGRTMIDEFDCCQGTVTHPSHPHLHLVLGPIATNQMFILAGQCDFDWTLGSFG